MISFQATTDLSKSAEITYANMRSYYQHYSVDWQQSNIVQQISGLDNWDILFDGEVVGAIRLQFDESGCYLRDLQISQAFQHQGIGAKALGEATRVARQSGAKQIRLRVFKISPAYGLYKRFGFEVIDEDDRFYSMAKDIAEKG